MLVTNHVLAGALLGSLPPLRRRPLTAFVVGVASHALLDATPHWGDRRHSVFLKVAVCDGLVGLTALLALARRAPRQWRWAVVAGMAGGAFPDLDKPSKLFFGASPFPRRVDEVHARIQRESPRRMPQEFVVALVAVVAARAVFRRP